MDRRRFLKYAGTTAVVVGASALGLEYFLKPQSTGASLTITSTSSKFDYPPVIDSVDVWPKYINPTDAYSIRFTEISHDPDGDPLTSTWLIDDIATSHDNPYVTKLPVGIHTASVQVSDGKNTVTGSTNPITVEPDQNYPVKQLHLGFKGMNYAAARVSPEFDSTPMIIPDHEELDEQLSTIHDELGCNAVSIWTGAGYEDNLIDGCKIALQKGFDRIYALSKYMHFTVDEITEKLTNLAPRIAELRQASDKIVWVIGNEFTYCVKGIIPGDTFPEQQAWVHQHHDGYIEAQQVNIPRVFEQILPVIRKNYNYPIAYEAEPNEIDLVPWGDPMFESVCWNAYLKPAYTTATADFLISKFSQLKRFQKLVMASEFGCATWTGAGQASDTILWNNQPYDENEQANSLDSHCKMFNTAGIDGAFLYIYNEEWDKGFGLYNGMKRKKGFYMYKSYQRVS